jgi:hypothetical protein
MIKAHHPSSHHPLRDQVKSEWELSKLSPKSIATPEYTGVALKMGN